VSSTELLKKLSLANGVVGANTVMPILEDYLFSLEGDVLTITASNLETTIITKLQVSAEEDGQIAITAKILLDTLKALPEQPITFDIDEGAKGVSIVSAYGKYKLAGDSADDFPELPESDNTETVELSSEMLSKAFAKTLFATSNDELRAAMQGVYMQIEASSIIFVATDAHKLVKYTFNTSTNDKIESFIIPKKGLTLLKNALKDDETVELAYNKKNAFFSFGDTEVMIRLIDAKYPDYNAVIPYDNANLLSLDRAEFQSSLRRIAIYANKSTNQVVLNISDGSLTVSAQDLDFSNEATEQMTCEYDGDAMNIGFNAKFLGEMLQVINTDQIQLKLSTPNRAGILVPAEQDENEELLMLVMPVMLGN